MDMAGSICLIPNLVDTDPFQGGGLALPVRRAARRDAGPPDTEMAGKPRPKFLRAAGGPIRPTEGSHPLPAGVVCGLLAVPALRRNPRLFGGQRMAVK